MNRIHKLKTIAAALLLGLTCLTAYAAVRPNIVLVITDDQGYGDLGVHGNPHLKTPAIDAFAAESIELTHFYVSPVCAPTRASIMTGRYNYRTSVTDTWFGSATMHQDEVTIAERLKAAGYATGIFGKWHLGDTYPYRPQDQGFERTLVHRGGGIAQPSCPPGNSYFDPWLLDQGEMRQFSGYCMDIYTDAALRFIEENRERPFFTYLATNTPHSPLQVSDSYAGPYRKAGLPDETAKIYGMVANIDENFARVVAKLEEFNLSRNTIVIFMSDNGPRVFSERRHRAGLRGNKTQVFDGGLRSPFFIRWPEKLDPGQKMPEHAAHIDLLPTLLSACQVAEDDTLIDGIDLMPFLKGETHSLPDRTLFFQWHRGPRPSLNRNFAAVGTRYKLLQMNNHRKPELPLRFELFDLKADPAETKDIAKEHPEVLRQMKADYEAWFRQVSETRDYPPSPSWIGSSFENPVVLTQQDRRGAKGWGDDRFFPDAHWPVRFLKDGNYDFTLRLFAPTEKKAEVFLQIGDRALSARLPKGATEYTFKRVCLDESETQVNAWVDLGAENRSPHFLDIQYIETP